MNKITESSVIVYEEYLRENEKSRETVCKYVSCLRRLMAWCGDEPLTKISLMTYRDELAQHYAPQTVNCFLSAVNIYLGLFHMEDCRVRHLKVQRQMFRPAERDLSRDEYLKLTKEARKQGRERCALIMETICSTGIRVGELKYITVEAAQSGKAGIRLKGKSRVILMPGKLCRKLLDYAKRHGIRCGEIFRTRNGTSLSRKLIWAQMKALCRSAGVEESKVFPHNLRHLFAKCFYGISKDVVKLADVLGHSAIETTRIYLMDSGEKHVKTLEEMRLIS